ncbi:MAG: hypothetical protein IJR83_06780 [Clostridia bacterium]|nr:hypothetical protein [Clostridia bacterium]
MTVSFDTEKELLQGLPMYPDGIVSPTVVSGGQGLRDGRAIDDPDDMGPFKDGETISDDTLRDRILQTQASLFYSEEGCVSLRYFHNQRTVFVKVDHGVVHAFFQDDFVKEDERVELVRTVTETGLLSFLDYIDSLKELGFELVFERDLENNCFREFRVNGHLVQCIFNGNTRTAHFIEDHESVAVKDFGNESVGPDAPEIYQLMTPYGRMVVGYSCDCGMCYVIKLSDKSLFIIDGFEVEQITKRITDYTIGLLRKLAGVRKGEKIRIAGWLCTHPHDDHYDLFAHLIRLYHDEIDLERVMFNFPDTNLIELLPQTYIVINRIRKYYPNVTYRKLHAGDLFTIGGATIDIIYSHELGMGPSGYEPRQNTNDTSLVTKITLGGVKFMCLGDTDTNTETITMKNLGESSLHADIVTASHHLINKLEHFYDVIHATYCLVPKHDRCQQPGVVDEEYLQITRTVRRDHFFFAGNGTDGFRCEDGKITHILHDPLIAHLYDGTLV